MLFSPSTGCGYPESLNYTTGTTSVPSDCITVTDDQFSQILTTRAEGGTVTVTNGQLVMTPYGGPTLAQTQATQIAIITNAYQNAITAPVSFTTAGGTTASFPQTVSAKQYLEDCIDAGSTAWTTNNLNLWLDVNNTPVTPFVFADLQGLAAAFETYEIPQYQDYLQKIAAVNTATTVADVQAIVF